jgi:hypothetical protein
MLLRLPGIDKHNPSDYLSALGKMMARQTVCYRVIRLNLPATFYPYPKGNWLKKS